jgi:hypothetical protein
MKVQWQVTACPRCCPQHEDPMALTLHVCRRGVYRWRRRFADSYRSKEVAVSLRARHPRQAKERALSLDVWALTVDGALRDGTMSLEHVHAQLHFVIADAVLAQIANEAAEERAEQRLAATLSPYCSESQWRAVLKAGLLADRERFAGVVGLTEGEIAADDNMSRLRQRGLCGKRSWRPIAGESLMPNPK